jgi:hypothetical protein
MNQQRIYWKSMLTRKFNLFSLLPRGFPRADFNNLANDFTYIL